MKLKKSMSMSMTRNLTAVKNKLKLYPLKKNPRKNQAGKTSCFVFSPSKRKNNLIPKSSQKNSQSLFWSRNLKLTMAVLT
jgi:hypothetical protein